MQIGKREGACGQSSPTPPLISSSSNLKFKSSHLPPSPPATHFPSSLSSRLRTRTRRRQYVDEDEETEGFDMSNMEGGSGFGGPGGGGMPGMGGGGMGGMDMQAMMAQVG